MKLANTIKGNLAILRIAHKHNKPVAEVRQSIQEALDASWAAVWTPGNIHAQVRWQLLFPGHRKPTAAEFIAVIANSLKTNASQLNAQSSTNAHRPPTTI